MNKTVPGESGEKFGDAESIGKKDNGDTGNEYSISIFTCHLVTRHKEKEMILGVIVFRINRAWVCVSAAGSDNIIGEWILLTVIW